MSYMSWELTGYSYGSVVIILVYKVTIFFEFNFIKYTNSFFTKFIKQFITK